jgi:D-lactate dehydrogenase
MRIVFFEVQEWEKEPLKENLPDSILTSEKLTAENASNFKDADIVSTFIYSKIDGEVFDKIPKLQLIATRSTGFDHIDAAKASEKGVKISNVPEYGTNTVAEHTFALILSLTRKIYQSINQTRNLNFDHSQLTGIDLYGKTLGIIGLGKIGEQVLKIGLGFGMNVLVHTRTQDKRLLGYYSFGYVDFKTLIQKSDIVTLHLPLTAETKHVISTRNITYFKKGSYLINTARGGLVETEAILLGIDQGILEGVGLDVLEEEQELTEELAVLNKSENQENLKTLVLNHVLINHPKVLITPHNAFNSQEALTKIDRTTIENIENFINGHPKNLV